MVTLVSPHLPEALAPLRDLALDLRWTWSHEADVLWEQIDAEALGADPQPLDGAAARCAPIA